MIPTAFFVSWILSVVKILPSLVIFEYNPTIPITSFPVILIFPSLVFKIFPFSPKIANDFPFSCKRSNISFPFSDEKKFLGFSSSLIFIRELLVISLFFPKIPTTLSFLFSVKVIWPLLVKFLFSILNSLDIFLVFSTIGFWLVLLPPEEELPPPPPPQAVSKQNYMNYQKTWEVFRCKHYKKKGGFAPWI